MSVIRYMRRIGLQDGHAGNAVKLDPPPFGQIFCFPRVRFSLCENFRQTSVFLFVLCNQVGGPFRVTTSRASSPAYPSEEPVPRTPPFLRSGDAERPCARAQSRSMSPATRPSPPGSRRSACVKVQMPMWCAPRKRARSRGHIWLITKWCDTCCRRETMHWYT